MIPRTTMNLSLLSQSAFWERMDVNQSWTPDFSYSGLDAGANATSLIPIIVITRTKSRCVVL